MTYNDDGARDDEPTGWSWVALANVCTILSGGTPPKSEAAYWNGDIPWVSGKDMKAPRLHDAIDHISAKGLDAGSRLAPAGSVLLLVRGMGLAKDLPVAVNSRPMAFNQDIKALVPRTNDLGPFIRAAIYHRRAQLLSRVVPSAHGTMTLNLDDIATFKILLPNDPDDAIAIASALDLMADLRVQADHELRGIEKLKRLFSNAVFARGLTRDQPNEPHIGDLPANWKLTGFLDAFELAQGQVDPKIEPYASMAHVGPENIEQATGRLLPCSTARDLGLISGKYLFKAGDIVYSKIRPYLRKAALPRFGGICSADMYPLSPREGFDTYYLFAFLLSDIFSDQAILHQQRTGIPKINREQLGTISVPTPPLDEQRAIGVIAAALDQKLDLHRRKRTLLDRLFNALLHKLMTGAVRATDLELSAFKENEETRAVV